MPLSFFVFPLPLHHHLYSCFLVFAPQIKHPVFFQHVKNNTLRFMRPLYVRLAGSERSRIWWLRRMRWIYTLKLAAAVSLVFLTTYSRNNRMELPIAGNERFITKALEPDMQNLQVLSNNITSSIVHTFGDLQQEAKSSRGNTTSSCEPVLKNKILDTDFVKRAQSLPPLSYADALSAKHTVRTWLTVSQETLDHNESPTAKHFMLRRARMASRSLARYCQSQKDFRADHVPEGGCPGEARALSNHSIPTYNWPWCFPPMDRVHIMSIECGILDNSLSHPNVLFTLFTKDVVVSTDRGRWQASSDVPVTEYEEIATMGAAEYATEPGKGLLLPS